MLKTRFPFVVGLVVLAQSGFAQQLNQNGKAEQVQLNTITTAVPFLHINTASPSGAIGSANCACSRVAVPTYRNSPQYAVH